MAAEFSAYSKDGSPYQEPDYIGKLLEDIDPVTVEVFCEVFEQFLPGDSLPYDDRVDPADLELLKFLRDLQPQHAGYDPLCTLFNNMAKVSGSLRTFKIVANHYETKESDFLSDLALYPDDAAAQNAFSRDVNDDNPSVARCAWAYMLVPIAVKCKDDEAGYGFSVGISLGRGKKNTVPLLRETPQSRESRAQFVKSNIEIFSRQHRTHVLSIYISGTTARFFRFDRAGCIVSKPINMESDFVYFRNLMYRLVNLPPKEMGFDQTVCFANEENLSTLRHHHAKKPKISKEYYQDCLDADPIRYFIYQISEVDENGEDLTPVTRTYLIGKMSAGNGSPTGRATRGYIAFEVETKRMVFLKDSWRAVSRKHTELETYRRLHAAEVEFIATPVAGGDISEQRTKSQSFMQNRPANMRPAERVHTRLVTKEIGRALETYEGSFELISFVYHAFFGHQDAWEKAGVLHHDISPGNILINIENGHGFLNDWDLAKYREDLEQGIAAAEPAGVSGTWPFKSALALRYPTKPAEVADDIESFIYIILYFSMRFHLHALSSAAPKGSSLEQQRASNAVNERLAVMFYDVFHAAERLPDGHSVGGTYKKLCIKTTFVPIQLQQIDNKPTPLARFLEKAYALLHRHYKRVNHAALASFAFKSTVQHTEMDAERKAAEEKAEQGGENLRSMWGLLERRAVPTYAPSSRGSTPSSRASSSALRPLDTHAALLNLFDHAFVNEDGSPMNIAPYRVDVLYDQCIGQNVMTSSRRKAYHGVDLRKLLSEARRQYCSGDSKDTGISDLASVAEVDEPVQEAENPRPGPRTRSGRGRTTRKVESPKRVAATKKPPAKKATSSTKAKGASRAATAQKKSTARKSAAMPRKADTTSTEPATGMRSLHVKKGAATTHCARRSTRLAVEVAQPPSPSGKRKRVDGGLDATAEAPELRIAAKRRPTARNKANDQQAPQRRSTRLAAKSGKTA